MAENDSDTPRRSPNPEHTRAAADADIERPDQGEDLGPVGELMSASADEAKDQATGEANDAEIEGEGVEAAQIFSIMLATAVTLAVAVFGVFWLVAVASDQETVARDAEARYPELREVERVAAEMENYSRADSLYRLPISVAMHQVTQAYGGGHQAATAAPQNFDMVYLDANAADRVRGVMSEEASFEARTEGVLPTQEPDADSTALGVTDMAGEEMTEPAAAGNPTGGNVVEQDEPEER